MTENRVPQTVAKQVRQHSPGNIALSIAILGVTLGAFLFGAFLGAIVGGLSSGQNSVGHVPAILIGGAIITLLVLIGTAVTIFQIARRHLAWPFALATFLVVVIGWVVVFLIWWFSPA